VTVISFSACCTLDLRIDDCECSWGSSLTKIASSGSIAGLLSNFAIN
jgi:hypothetical protein